MFLRQYNKIMKKKNITIDELAVMVQNGFDDVTENIATKKQVASLDLKMNNMEGKMDKMEGKMTNVAIRLMWQ